MTIQLLMHRGRLIALLAAALLTGCGQREAPAATTPPPVAPPAAAGHATPDADEDEVMPAREAAAAAGRAATITVTDADAGRTLRLQKGQAVVVRLPADRGAGLTWIPAGHALPVVTTDGVPGFEPATAAGAAGPGIEIWRFIALQPGQAELVFDYRSLQGGGRPVQTLVYSFKVE